MLTYASRQTGTGRHVPCWYGGLTQSRDAEIDQLSMPRHLCIVDLSCCVSWLPPSFLVSHTVGSPPLDDKLVNALFFCSLIKFDLIKTPFESALSMLKNKYPMIFEKPKRLLNNTEGISRIDSSKHVDEKIFHLLHDKKRFLTHFPSCTTVSQSKQWWQTEITVCPCSNCRTENKI